MPRSRKLRQCNCPFHAESESVFKPAGIAQKDLAHYRLQHDELESFYLCDGLGFTQAEAGAKMGISRGTVQRLLASGKKKIALALVEGAALRIEAAPQSQTERE